MSFFNVTSNVLVALHTPFKNALTLTVKIVSGSLVRALAKPLSNVIFNPFLEACEGYPTSKVKLEEMIEVLDKQRYVSFIN